VNKTLTIHFFGQLTDLTGSSRVSIANAKDTDELCAQVVGQFPLLKDATYVVAVDRKIVRQNTPLDNVGEIAFLPPFSGG
jgi:sulfur-carrier protein